MIFKAIKLFLHTLASIVLTLSFVLYSSCETIKIDSHEKELLKLTSVMIVPDIQNYTDGDYKSMYLDSIASYYLSNIDSFAACFQVGDLTNHNRVNEYQNANKHFFSMFPEGKEPYFCLGNHDYGSNGSSNVRESNLPDYMKPEMDFQMEGCKHENYVRFLRLGSKDYAVLDLEFAPRNETIEWAKDVVEKYMANDFIILTHVFTNRRGQIHDAKDDNVYHPGSQKDYYMGGDYINDSMEIFNKLIKDNPNIKMVICGHTFTPNYIEVTSRKNSFDKDVYIITVNYQHYTEGGNGFVGILDFYEKGYRIRSFSTVTHEYGPRDISFGNFDN